MKFIKSLDNFFKEKSKKDILYLFVITFSLIGFLIYYFIYPLSSEFQKKEESIYEKNMHTLNSLQMRKNTLIGTIALLKKETKTLSLTKNSLYKQKSFFDDLVSLLDFIEFNKYKWAQYVKDIVYDAKNEGLKLLSFENKIYPSDKNSSSFINKKMDITLNIKGEYKNLIYYMYKYENRRELLRVSEINASDKGIFMIKYSLYGYEK